MAETETVLLQKKSGLFQSLKRDPTSEEKPVRHDTRYPVNLSITILGVKRMWKRVEQLASETRLSERPEAANLLPSGKSVRGNEGIKPPYARPILNRIAVRAMGENGKHKHNPR